jgi:hypothetical protein
MPVVVGKETTVRVTFCATCDTEYQYSCWVIATRNGMTFHKVELEQVA